MEYFDVLGLYDLYLECKSSGDKRVGFFYRAFLREAEKLGIPIF